MNVQDVTLKLASWNDMRSDLSIRMKELYTVDRGGILKMKLGRTEGQAHLWDYSINGWAVGQLAGRLDIPPRYIKKCPADLAANNINYWINHLPDRRWVLCMYSQDRIIGVVSSRFASYRNLEFFDDTMTICRDYQRDIRDFTLVDTCMDMKVVFPELVVTDTRTGKDIGIGLHIRNSEVGYSSSIVVASIHIPYSGHTLVLESFLKYSFVRKVHRGQDRSGFKDGIVELIAAIRSNYKEVLNLYMTSGNYTITVANVKDLITEYNLAKNVLDGHLGIELFAEETNPESKVNLRELIDSIMEMAKEQKYPRKWELERIGGNVLNRFGGALGW